jgi:PadR family transcriptional regulator
LAGGQQLISPFVAANRSRDVNALTQLLAATCASWADGGGKVATALNVLRSRAPVPFDRPMEARYSIGMPNREPSKAEVIQGTLDLMVLQTLRALGPLHGYAIASRLEQVSGGALQLNMGTLYPALMRLEQRGLLRGNWGTTDNNRKARFYSLTSAGRRELAREKQAWDRMAAIMHALLRDA